MESVGLIETKGDVAAIVGADAMLKAANVNLLEKTYVGGGLVSVAVMGDVAAVKASVEAGAGAIHNLNKELLISKHVIPRPQEDLSNIVLSGTPLKDRSIENEKLNDNKGSNEEDDLVSNKNLKSKDIKDEKDKSFKKEIDFEKDIKKIDLDKPESKEVIDNMASQYGMEELDRILNRFKVVELRKLARKYDDFGIKGREISRADKRSIIKEFILYYSSN